MEVTLGIVAGPTVAVVGIASSNCQPNPLELRGDEPGTRPVAVSAAVPAPSAAAGAPAAEMAERSEGDADSAGLYVLLLSVPALL